MNTTETRRGNTKAADELGTDGRQKKRRKTEEETPTDEHEVDGRHGLRENTQLMKLGKLKVITETLTN